MLPPQRRQIAFLPLARVACAPFLFGFSKNEAELQFRPQALLGSVALKPESLRQYEKRLRPTGLRVDQDSELFYNLFSVTF